MDTPKLSSTLMRTLQHRAITAKQEKKHNRKRNVDQTLIEKQTKEFLKSGGKIQYLPIGKSGVEI